MKKITKNLIGILASTVALGTIGIIKSNLVQAVNPPQEQSSAEQQTITVRVRVRNRRDYLITVPLDRHVDPDNIKELRIQLSNQYFKDNKGINFASLKKSKDEYVIELFGQQPIAALDDFLKNGKLTEKTRAVKVTVSLGNDQSESKEITLNVPTEIKTIPQIREYFNAKFFARFSPLDQPIISNFKFGGDNGTDLNQVQVKLVGRATKKYDEIKSDDVVVAKAKVASSEAQKAEEEAQEARRQAEERTRQAQEAKRAEEAGQARKAQQQRLLSTITAWTGQIQKIDEELKESGNLQEVYRKLAKIQSEVNADQEEFRIIGMEKFFQIIKGKIDFYQNQLQLKITAQQEKADQERQAEEARLAEEVARHQAEEQTRREEAERAAEAQEAKGAGQAQATDPKASQPETISTTVAEFEIENVQEEITEIRSNCKDLEITLGLNNSNGKRGEFHLRYKVPLANDNTTDKGKLKKIRLTAKTTEEESYYDTYSDPSKYHFYYDGQEFAIDKLTKFEQGKKIKVVVQHPQTPVPEQPESSLGNSDDFSNSQQDLQMAIASQSVDQLVSAPKPAEVDQADGLVGSLKEESIPEEPISATAEKEQEKPLGTHTYNFLLDYDQTKVGLEVGPEETVGEIKNRFAQILTEKSGEEVSADQLKLVYGTNFRDQVILY